MATHVIELNGQKYDASTGKPVSVAAVTSAKQTKKLMDGPKHLDGFSRRPNATPRTATVSKAVHAKTQKSQTLMRKGVKKPVAPAKIHAKVAAPAASRKATSPQPKLEVSKPGRTIRATSISQSSLISKFGKTATVIKSEVVPVKPAPVHAAAPKPKASAVAATTKVSVAHLAPKAVAHHRTTATHTGKKDVFQAALENAASHKAPKIKKSKLHHRVAKKLHVHPRVVTFSSMTLAVLAVGGILAYQNMPEIAMKVASARAGLNANLPAYQPSGFSLAGPIEYDNGEVTLSYKSNSDERAFNVIQKNSSWNSETLLENFVATSNQPYQTFQANGRTIYIYDGNKATWVDGGIWFNIDGEANLNSDQLLRIADSL